MRMLPVLTRLAWRNLWRNHRRTIIMLSAISIGVWAMIFMTALSRGMVDQMIEDGVSALPGHVQVHNKQFLDDPSVSNRILISDAELSRIFGSANFKAWASRVKVPAVISSEYESRGVTLLGIDPVRGTHFWLPFLRRSRRTLPRGSRRQRHCHRPETCRQAGDQGRQACRADEPGSGQRDCGSWISGRRPVQVRCARLRRRQCFCWQESRAENAAHRRYDDRARVSRRQTIATSSQPLNASRRVSMAHSKSNAGTRWQPTLVPCSR